MEYRIEERRRVRGHDEALAAIKESSFGLTVPPMEPNVTDAVLYVDPEQGNAPVLAYLPLPRGTGELRRAVRSIDWSGGSLRARAGIKVDSRTFGMAPRKAHQLRETCRPTRLARDAPEQHAVLVALGDLLGEMLEELAPEVVAQDRLTMEAVEDEWRLASGSTWTSGVVNNTAVLPYHVDGFNFHTWSSMPVLRRGVRGGHLSVPEYDLCVECRDGWVVSFCGRDLWHGVTPIETVEPDAYRISVVFYSLRGMKDCFTYAIESAQAQTRRTKREDTMAEVLRGERPYPDLAGQKIGPSGA